MSNDPDYEATQAQRRSRLRARKALARQAEPEEWMMGVRACACMGVDSLGWRIDTHLSEKDAAKWLAAGRKQYPDADWFGPMPVPRGKP